MFLCVFMHAMCVYECLHVLYVMYNLDKYYIRPDIILTTSKPRVRSCREIGVGISWPLTIRFDSDSVVNDSILNRLSILHRLSILNRLSIINSKPIKRLSMHLDF